MKDVSLHLLDILENSAKAGAGRVVVDLVSAGTWLELTVTDNGPGLPEEVRVDPANPFCTTRRDRVAGMGLALLRETAEQTGGALEIREPAGGGVQVRGHIDMGHIDAKPLGSIADVIAAATLAWPALDLVVRVGTEAREVWNTAEAKAALDGVDIGHPAVQRVIRDQLQRELQPLADWTLQAFAGSGGSGAARHGIEGAVAMAAPNGQAADDCLEKTRNRT